MIACRQVFRHNMACQKDLCTYAAVEEEATAAWLAATVPMTCCSRIGSLPDEVEMTCEGCTDLETPRSISVHFCVQHRVVMMPAAQFMHAA